MDDATVTVLEQAARRLKDTNLSAVPDPPRPITAAAVRQVIAAVEDGATPDEMRAFTVPDEEVVAELNASFDAAVERMADEVSAIQEKQGRRREATLQPTLDDALFPPVRKSDTPMVKVTISGTVEMTQADYLAFLDGSRIGPGAVVEIRAAGYVVQPGAAWVRRTEGSGEDKQTWHEREGRVKVKITDLAGFAATGEEWGDV